MLARRKQKQAQVTLHTLIENNIESLHFFLLLGNICLFGATEAQKKFIINEFSSSLAQRICNRHEHFIAPMQAAISAGLSTQQTNFKEIFKSFLEQSAQTRAVSMTTYYISLMHTIQSFKSINYRADNKILFKEIIDKSENDKAIANFALHGRNVKLVPPRLWNLIYDNEIYADIYAWTCDSDVKNSLAVLRNKKEDDKVDAAVEKTLILFLPIIFFALFYGSIRALLYYAPQVVDSLDFLKPYLFNMPVGIAVCAYLFVIYPMRIRGRYEQIKKMQATDQEYKAIDDFKAEHKNDMEALAELLNEHFNLKFVEYENTTCLTLETSSLSKTFSASNLKEEPEEKIKSRKRVRVYLSEKPTGSEAKAIIRTPAQVEYESSSTQIIRRLPEFKTTLIFDKQVKEQIKDKTEYKLFKRAFKQGRFANKGGTCIKTIYPEDGYDAEIKIKSSEHRIAGKKTVTDQGPTYVFNHYRRGFHN